MTKEHIINSVKGGKAVYDFIVAHDCHNVAQMSREIGVSIPTINKALSRFIKEGIIEKVEDGRRFKPARYKVN